VRKSEVTFESIGASGYIGQYIGHRGGKEIKLKAVPE